MVIAALATFATLLAAWLVAPSSEQRDRDRARAALASELAVAPRPAVGERSSV